MRLFRIFNEQFVHGETNLAKHGWSHFSLETLSVSSLPDDVDVNIQFSVPVLEDLIHSDKPESIGMQTWKPVYQEDLLAGKSTKSFKKNA